MNRTISAEAYYAKNRISVDHALREGLPLPKRVLGYDVPMKERTQRTDPVWFTIVGDLAKCANDT